MRRPRPRLLVAALGLGLGLVVGGGCQRDGERSVEPETVEPSPPAPLEGWRYEVTVDPTLDFADVTICFDGSPPELLIPGIPLASRYVSEVRSDQGVPLTRSGRGYALDPVAADGCASYRMDFAGLAASEDAGRLIGRTGNSLMARPSVWLWRPDSLPAGAEASLRFSMPDSMEVSVPWPTIDGGPRGESEATYRLDRTAFRWLAYAIFGEVTVDRFERAGVEVELVTLDAEIRCPPEGLRAWVLDAVDTVALLFDGFPRDRLQVVVLPVEGGGGGTVYFGLAGRGGGPGIYVFLDDTAEADELPGGWTTVHEMLHHGMPFIDEPWMAEGWVSYYTELMRTRIGHRSELEGWQALLDAFERGRRRSLEMTLAETSERMHDTHAYQRVYWGGASVAFLVDVRMRLETEGERGLDDAMLELRRCCGDAQHMWEARELLERLDAWYGRSLFSETAAAVLAESELPDVEATMSELGVVVSEGRVRLDDAHPGATARRAIMAPRG